VKGLEEKQAARTAQLHRSAALGAGIASARLPFYRPEIGDGHMKHVDPGRFTRHVFLLEGTALIYLLGASHIVAILDGCRAETSLVPDFDQSSPPRFRDWPLREGVLPDRMKMASIYIGHVAMHWGPHLAEILPERRLGIAAGFQSLLATIETDGEARALFVSMRGEEYFHLGQLGVAHPYDFLLPERPDLALAPDRPLLPLAVVQHQMVQAMSRTLLALTAMRKLLPRVRIVRIVPPPPTASEDVTRWTAENSPQTHHTERLPSALRLKLWLLYTRLLEEGTRALQLEVLPVPGAALHPTGLLRREYMADAIHGNALYGGLVCGQMANVCTETLECAT